MMGIGYVINLCVRITFMSTCHANPWSGIACNWCKKTGATIISQCGTCVYHPKCAISAKNCACGYQNISLVDIGTQCIACNRKRTTDLVCDTCMESFHGAIKGISKRGIQLDTSAAHTFLSSNSLMIPQIGDPCATILAKCIFESALKHIAEICLYDGKVFKVEQAMTLCLLKTNCARKITDLAKEVGVDDAAVGKFKEYHWESDRGVTLNKKRTAAKPKHMGVSVISRKSLIEKLELCPSVFQSLRPLLESWDGAAHVLREEVAANRLMIVDSKYCAYSKTPSAPSEEAKEAWFEYIREKCPPE